MGILLVTFQVITLITLSTCGVASLIYIKRKHSSGQPLSLLILVLSIIIVVESSLTTVFVIESIFFYGAKENKLMLFMTYAWMCKSMSWYIFVILLLNDGSSKFIITKKE